MSELIADPQDNGLDFELQRLLFKVRRVLFRKDISPTHSHELFAKPAKERYFYLPPVVWWLWV